MADKRSQQRGQPRSAEVPQPDHRQVLGVRSVVVKGVAHLAGIEVEAHGADGEQAHGKHRRADHLIVQRQKCHAAESDAQSREDAGQKHFEQFHQQNLLEKEKFDIIIM